ncbi:MAG TPA: tRNA lysidine(34) synthetase TilS [Verrucomicrobiae bacterium]|nr:tRNA lysidine(34) synthetase TilS [Verrucomicrobiae bacterium]
MIAVSGGVDSMVLLRALHELSDAHGWKLAVAHFNHQLRVRAADADERLVGKIAKALKLPFVAGRGDVRGLARRQGISLEMAGRQLRHEFLASTARARRIPSVALAHHADDQVELFFLRVFRGVGGQGLGGMKWSAPSPAHPSILLVRPMLNQSKAAVCDAAKTAEIEFSEDATNAQLDMERNRVRHVLIPFLRANFSEPLLETVPRLMELVRGEAEVVTDLAKQWLSSRRRTKFSLLPVAVQRRAIHLQLIAMGHAPDFDIVERLREGIGQPFALDAGRTVSRDADGVLHERKSEKTSFNPARKIVVLKGNKRQEWMDGLGLSWKIGRVRGTKFTAEPNVEYFDADKVGPRICLRHWQPGDRFQPIGAATPRKLQDLLTNAKIPRAERHRRIVAVTDSDEPFWVEGLRISERFKLTPATVRRLKWQWLREM